MIKDDLSQKDACYTFSGVSPEPVGRRDIHKFFIKFREQVPPLPILFFEWPFFSDLAFRSHKCVKAVAAGGPVITSDVFLRMTNVIRNEVGV